MVFFFPSSTFTCTPEIFGVAESTCSARAGFSTGIILGARLTTGCVAAGTSLLGSIGERTQLVWLAVWTCNVCTGRGSSGSI